MQRRARLRLLGAAAVIVSAAGMAVASQPAIAGSSGPVAHFVVLGTKSGGAPRAEKAVTDSGGTVVTSWPQIGVVVATSSSADFAKVVRTKPGVAGAGATQNLAELVAPPTGLSARAEAERLLEDTSSVVDSVKGDADPLSINQWDMRLIKADKAHAVNAGSPNVVVGVLDSGIEASHPDLAANVDASRSVGCANQGVPDTSPAAWAPTTSDHGTHVAGIIAAARNGVGIVGVAPGVRLASIKVVNDQGFIYPEYAICGLIWAAEHGVKVTNNSYFVDPWYFWCDDNADQKAVAEAIDRAVQYSHHEGVVNVVALGNSNVDLSRDMVDTGSPNNGTPISRNIGSNCASVPAANKGMVGVSAVGVRGLKAYYSNFGRNETKVAAPGGDRTQVPNTADANGRILSTVINGQWGYKQGTSMAAPHAAGVAALIVSAHPGWSRQRVIAALGHEATRLPCPSGVYNPDGTGKWKAICEGGSTGRGFYGAGLIDALDAVK